MNKILAMCLSLCLLSLVGCQTDEDHHPQTAMTDVCSHCPGDQKMTADGRCEKCGAKVDVCGSCPGMQTMTADGHCSACGTKIAVKS